MRNYVKAIEKEQFADYLWLEHTECSWLEQKHRLYNDKTIYRLFMVITTHRLYDDLTTYRLFIMTTT